MIYANTEEKDGEYYSELELEGIKKTYKYMIKDGFINGNLYFSEILNGKIVKEGNFPFKNGKLEGKAILKKIMKILK